MRRKQHKVHQRILSTQGGVIPLNANLIEVKDVANQYPYPEFLQETMFAEHGTEVLITDPAADKYLEQAKKMKEKYPQWAEPEGDPSF